MAASLARLALALLLAAAPLVAAAAELQAVPPLSRHVLDQAGLLGADGADRLESRLVSFEQRSGSQIAVLIVATTAPESIEQYSIRVFEAWKLGRAQFNDGILILVATGERKLRIDTGYGLEGAIPDAVAKRIVAETLAPKLRAGDAYGGLLAAVEQIERLIEGEKLPAGRTGAGTASGVGWDQLLLLFIIGATVVGGVLNLVLGRFFGGLASGGLIGALAWLLSGSVLAAGLGAILVFFYVLITGGRVGSSIGGGWGGGGWSSGGGSWGGGASGGWSGGGGSAGGGGASGSW